MELVTLTFCRNNGQVLLGLKRRGFNTNKWNGYGGKVLPHESILGSAVREIWEEAGLVIHVNDLKPAALLHVYHGDTHVFECYTFITEEWRGDPQPTDEMERHQWFPVDCLPFDDMRIGDDLWIPEMFYGALRHVNLRYDAEGKDVLFLNTSPLYTSSR